MLVFLQRLSLLLTREHLLRAIGDIDHIRQFVTQKTKRFLKRALYGTGIGVTSLVAIGALMVAFGVTPFPEPAQAGVVNSAVVSIAGFFAQIILAPIYVLFGVLSAVFAGILDMVIGYPWSPSWVAPLTTSSTAGGGFVNVSAVVTGWRIVRDICNLFFAIILLIIALAAVLNLESYKWQDLLRKFVLYAVLINFSKTICGFFTDAATVAMATFGGTIGFSWGSSIIGAFGLPALGGLTELAGLQDQLSAEDGIVNMLGAIVLMVFFQVTALAIIAAFVVMLVLRIVMLWFLIVLSPIAYVTRILDITKRYSSQWWEMWGRYVVMGPFIVFFLWLTLTMMNGSATGADANGIGGAAATPLIQGLTEVEQLSQVQGTNGSTLTGLSSISAFQATQPNIIANFAIALVMMSGALRFASGMSGEIGQYVGNVSNAVSGASTRLIGTANRLASNRAGEMKKGQLPKLLGGALGKFIPSLQGQQFSDLTSGGGRVYSNLGYGLDILSNTVLDPIGAYTNFTNNLDRATAEKEKTSTAGFQAMGDELAGPQQSRLTRAVGILTGAFTEEGTVHFREALTVPGLAKRAFESIPGTPFSATAREAQENEEIKNALSAENVAMASAVNATTADQEVSQLESRLRTGDPTDTLNLSDPVVSGSITAQIADLRSKAAAVATTDPTAAAGFNDAATDLDALLAGGGTAAFSQIDGALAKASLSRTDLVAARRVQSQKSLTAARSVHDKAKRDRELLQYNAYRLRGATNLEGQALQDRQVAEAGKGLETLEPIELKGEFFKSMLGGNKNRSLAIMRRLAETGNFSWAFRSWTQELLDSPKLGLQDTFKKQLDLDPILPKQDVVDGKGVIIDKGLMDPTGQKVVMTDGAAGQELFRRAMLVDTLGMDEQESLRFMGSRIAAPEGKAGKKAFIGGFGIDPTGYVFQPSPLVRRDIGNMVSAPKSFVDYRQRDANAAVVRDGYGSAVSLDPSGLSDLQAFQKQLDTDVEFNAWNIDAKVNYSSPTIIKQLRAAGINASLIARLEKFAADRAAGLSGVNAKGAASGGRGSSGAPGPSGPSGGSGGGAPSGGGAATGGGTAGAPSATGAPLGGASAATGSTPGPNGNPRRPARRNRPASGAKGSGSNSGTTKKPSPSAGSNNNGGGGQSSGAAAAGQTASSSPSYSGGGSGGVPSTSGGGSSDSGENFAGGSDSGAAARAAAETMMAREGANPADINRIGDRVEYAADRGDTAEVAEIIDQAMDAYPEPGSGTAGSDTPGTDTYSTENNGEEG